MFRVKTRLIEVEQVQPLGGWDGWDGKKHGILPLVL
jgi:hypothetical protein